MRSSVCGSLEAGPSVATILVLLNICPPVRPSYFTRWMRLPPLRRPVAPNAVSGLIRAQKCRSAAFGNFGLVSAIFPVCALGRAQTFREVTRACHADSPEGRHLLLRQRPRARTARQGPLHQPFLRRG